MYKRINVSTEKKHKYLQRSIFKRYLNFKKRLGSKNRKKRLIRPDPRFILRVIYFLEKRERFALSTVILTAGVLVTQLIWQDVRFAMVIFLSLASYILTAWSLREDIKGNEWLLLFILPVLFTASLSMFYFLLPARMIIRLTTSVIFAVGTYAILLIENIYNVAAQRSIQLLRAAQSIGLLLTLTVIFLSANIIYSLRLGFMSNALILTLLSFFLGLQSLWSVKPESRFSQRFFIHALVIAFGVGELSLALSFWPIENASYSLLIAAAYYSLVGIIQQHFNERLFFNVVREYMLVFFFTFLLTFLTTRWG
ncbi:MAG: hypothetical protein UV73_C0009G0028 [Candidatus Gottesmanbacteria bacterium GW2011_GWA2_43_14]|uniref:Uncharacterized protein n=1 Tax=Candidatus Gottesmanbacteria bacterium GW2011_GWA2_43_14 TaxID=1618443 RepID=A0A0G1DGK2_9BACT|nr:MAG: hypothetical protein UV73_C0009G0028 [Candidatus Gottesmanbacteria bacterium GW2011_GWA2_43_14]